jgi:hypothetical protein
MAHSLRHGLVYALATTAACMLLGTNADAQALGLNLRGDVGLKSGSQPHPGLYVALPLFYGNDYDGLRDASGHKIADGLELDMSLLATPGITAITDWTLFGGTYGLSIIFPLTKSRVEIAQADVSAREGYGTADLYVQPLQLGWHSSRADFVAGYAFFMPSGAGNRSMHMWAHELSAGSTIFLDEHHRWHLATTAFYDLHHNKSGKDLRVGDILTLEGGLGGSFLKGVGSAGIAYVAQWKITNDSGDDFPAVVPKSKSRVFGLGPEITVPLFTQGSLFGLLNVRYVWEFGGRASFEGRTFVAGFTLAKLQLP